MRTLSLLLLLAVVIVAPGCARIEPPTTQMTFAAASFGPPIERVLPSGAPCMQQYFQFRNGKTFVVGNGPATTKAEYDQDWKQAEDAGGIDISALSGDEAIQLVGHGCIFTCDVGELKWDTFTPAQVVNSMKRVRFSYGVLELKTKDLPVTYLFKTTRGEVGIMEILGVVENERAYNGEGHKGRGMKFRYKLVQQPDTRKTAQAETQPASG